MGAHGRRGAWACLGVALLLGVVQLAGASHVVYDLENLEVEAATAAVPASNVDPQLRTGYHFQPPKNWINGKKQTSHPKLALLLDEVDIEGAA